MQFFLFFQLVQVIVNIADGTVFDNQFKGGFYAHAFYAGDVVGSVSGKA